MWNRNYSETRLPATPSTIIELLSHQNFADMQLSHNPNFKFTVGRAIYKGILQFINSQHSKRLCNNLFGQQLRYPFRKKEKYTGTYLEKGRRSAGTDSPSTGIYGIYTHRIRRIRQRNSGQQTYYNVKVEPGLVYSFKVTAVNRGEKVFLLKFFRLIRQKT